MVADIVRAEERLTATEYDRWMTKANPWAWQMRFLMGPVGALLVNTGVLRLPRLLNLQPHQRLLDLGCGRASVLRLLWRRVPFQRPPVGLDISRVMLRLAPANRNGISPHLAQGSVTSLPFPGESFDVVVAGHVIKHLSDGGVADCFRDVWRVLTPGGVFAAWEFGPAPWPLWHRLNRRLLTFEVHTAYLRSFSELANIAAATPFRAARQLDLRPFLYPPIPRVAILLRKDAQPG